MVFLRPMTFLPSLASAGGGGGDLFSGTSNAYRVAATDRSALQLPPSSVMGDMGDLPSAPPPVQAGQRRAAGYSGRALPELSSGQHGF